MNTSCRCLALVSFAASLLACEVPAVLGIREGRCDLRPARAQCTDLRNFKGPSLLTFQGVCETLKLATPDGGATYTEGARCDAVDLIGGCQSSSLDGSKQTNWYYKSTKYMTAADAMAECDGVSTFVTE